MTLLLTLHATVYNQLHHTKNVERQWRKKQLKVAKTARYTFKRGYRNYVGAKSHKTFSATNWRHSFQPRFKNGKYWTTLLFVLHEAISVNRKYMEKQEEVVSNLNHIPKIVACIPFCQTIEVSLNAFTESIN